MHVVFSQPKDKDGNTIVHAQSGLGLLLAHATVAPISPALPDVELYNFGIWQDAAGTINVTVPSMRGKSNPYLRPASRIVKGTREDETTGKMEPFVELKPMLGGQKSIDRLTGAIHKVWVDNPAIRFSGDKFDITALLATTNVADTAQTTGGSKPQPSQGNK